MHLNRVLRRVYHTMLYFHFLGIVQLLVSSMELYQYIHYERIFSFIKHRNIKHRRWRKVNKKQCMDNLDAAIPFAGTVEFP